MGKDSATPSVNAEFQGPACVLTRSGTRKGFLEYLTLTRENSLCKGTGVREHWLCWVDLSVQEGIRSGRLGGCGPARAPPQSAEPANHSAALNLQAPVAPGH